MLVLFAGATFGAMYLRTVTLLSEQALNQARGYADLIVTTRAWNAHYEGVWVEKRPGAETNPFLRKLGVEPELRTADGRVLTLRNPAMMTRELSERLKSTDGVTFGLTSLKPVNPANTPDDWERTALHSFERGAREADRTDPSGPHPVLRYVRALKTEKACLKCHASQGYKAGDVRGAISVTVPLLYERRILLENALWIVAAGLISAAALAGAVYLLVSQLSKRIEQAEESLVLMATTCELTGLKNRRFVIERLDEEVDRAQREHAPVGVVMLDLDHFKRINDTHGHAVGDEVLKQVAHRLAGAVRDYDILGRIGGEEFLVVAPGADLAETADLAERLRAAVARAPVQVGDVSVSMTLSAGVTTSEASPVRDTRSRADRALARADDALYRAKDTGRDRVVSIPSSE